MNLALLLAAVLFTVHCHAAKHHRPVDSSLAPGYGELEFELPAPGSYTLPVLGEAVDAALVDSRGKPVSLHDLTGDKFVLLGFIYTRCSDVNGCPLASHVMSKVQDAVVQSPVLKDHVRIVSFSFDPENDTPDVLAAYAANFRNPGFDWRFVTVRRSESLDGVLDSYGQFIIRDVDNSGRVQRAWSHLLRVYLIDQHRQIRNIYSVSFLHADTIINDIRTIVGDSVATASTGIETGKGE